jgi:phage terminase large subunit-like protein
MDLRTQDMRHQLALSLIAAEHPGHAIPKMIEELMGAIQGEGIAPETQAPTVPQPPASRPPRLIDPADWAMCGGRFDPEALIGKPCFAGLEAADTCGLAAFAALFPDGEVVVMGWIPMGVVDDLSEQHQVDYLELAYRGDLTLTPGRRTDDERIARDVAEFHEAHNIACLGIDPWNGTNLMEHLASKLPARATAIRQSFRVIGPVTEELVQRVKDGRLKHGGNRLLEAGVKVAGAHFDPDYGDGLRRPCRIGSRPGTIATVHALLNAIAARLEMVGKG